ncbi:MAG TPA: hypothetical protein ENI07_23920 [Desulfobacterales bacterium]|nr:hypothetical protein [Desulfobacterales bacterium]
MTCKYKNCQFSDYNPKELNHEDNIWCQFHTPESFYNYTEEYSISKFESIVDEFETALDKYLKENIKNKKKINLKGVVFPADVRLNNKIIPSDISFLDAIFMRHNSFIDTVFEQRVYFTNTIFRGLTTFSGAKFLRHCSFLSTQFNHKAYFSKVNEEVEFCETANFRAASFNALTDFTAAIFHDDVDFTGLPDSIADSGEVPPETFPTIRFQGAIFKKSSKFNNRKFLDSPIFSDCIFYIAPEFHNSELHQGIIFNRAKFIDFKSKGASSAYRTLRLAMLNMRFRKEEGMFYALEQKSLLYSGDMGMVERFTSRCYNILADYGLSISRPLLFLLLTLSLFVFIYASLASSALSFKYDIDWNIISQSFGFSMEQILAPFKIWQLDQLPQWACDQSPNLNFVNNATCSPFKLLLFKFLGTFQSLISLILLTLTLLGVRWRFRRN